MLGDRQTGRPRKLVFACPDLRMAYDVVQQVTRALLLKQRRLENGMPRASVAQDSEARGSENMKTSQTLGPGPVSHENSAVGLRGLGAPLAGKVHTSYYT